MNEENLGRKNVFQLVEENYNVQDEIIKIANWFERQNYFYRPGVSYINLKTLVDDILLFRWNKRGTCLKVDEFLTRANAQIDTTGKTPNSELHMINYLECIENFVKLFRTNLGYLHANYELMYSKDKFAVFLDLVETLEQHLGLSKRCIDDYVVLYSNNVGLEAVLQCVSEEATQWELIQYCRNKQTLDEKRKSLAFLATNLNMEQDRDEKNKIIVELMKKETNILNNLHIRHNNQTGKHANEELKEIDQDDAVKLCDYAYNLMLTVVLLREQKQYETVYDNFNSLQKQAGNKTADQ